jgi:hypothetical protein
MLSVIMLSVFMLSVIMLSVFMLDEIDAECHICTGDIYGNCHSVLCLSFACQGAIKYITRQPTQKFSQIHFQIRKKLQKPLITF